jgi:hypothetical protein
VTLDDVPPGGGFADVLPDVFFDAISSPAAPAPAPPVC